MKESGLTEIIPLTFTLTIYRTVSYPESPKGAQLGVAAVLDGLKATTSCVY